MWWTLKTSMRPIVDMCKIRIIREPIRSRLIEMKREYESKGLECTPVLQSAHKGLFMLGWWDPAKNKPKPQFKSLQELYDEDERGHKP